MAHGEDKREQIHAYVNSIGFMLIAPSNLLVDCQVSGLGTEHPLLTFDHFSTWILLHDVCSPSYFVYKALRQWSYG